jgi:phage/plasmid-associated DNA primase
MTERGGIFNMLVGGLIDYMTNGFMPSERMRRQLEIYRGNMDWAEVFIRECLYIDASGEMGWELDANTLYAIYVEWSFVGGNTPITQNSFGRRMHDKFKWERRKIGCVYLHIMAQETAFPADAVRVDQFRRRKPGSSGS